MEFCPAHPDAWKDLAIRTLLGIGTGVTSQSTSGTPSRRARCHDPRRLFAAQVILYVGGGMILLVAVLSAHGAEQPLGPGVAAPASAPAEQLKTENGDGHARDRYLTTTYEQIPEDGKERGLLLTDGISLSLDGLFCHALSVFALVFDVMP